MPGKRPDRTLKPHSDGLECREPTVAETGLPSARLSACGTYGDLNRIPADCDSRDNLFDEAHCLA